MANPQGPAPTEHEDVHSADFQHVLRALLAAYQPYAAKTSALMALGYLINKSGDRRALDYLKASATPDAWAAKNISGVAPFQRSVSERNRDFSKFAILGLALTGNPEAAQVLRQLQVPAASPATREFQAQVGDVISEALRENQKISEQGLMNYYRTQRR
jgi:hypothetical protein